MLIWQDCEHFNFLVLVFCKYDQWLTFIPTSKVKIAAKKKSLESIPNTLNLVRSNSNFIYSNTITEKKVYLWKSNQLSQGNSSSHCLRQQGLLMLKIQRKPETIVNVFVRKKRKYPIFRCILLIGPKLGPEAYASSKLCEFILHQILPNGSGWAISHLINMIFLSGQREDDNEYINLYLRFAWRAFAILPGWPAWWSCRRVSWWQSNESASGCWKTEPD